MVPAPVATGRLAVFDLDRTLIPGSSLLPLARRAARLGLVSTPRLAAESAREALFARRGAGTSTAERLVARLLGMVAGLEAEPLLVAAREAAADVVAQFRPAARDLVDHHRAAGDRCIVLSASPEPLVAEVARLAGLSLGIGTRIETIGGRLTGRLNGPFCHGPGKLARLRDELGVTDLSSSTAYSDSASDLPLLEAAGHPVAMSPDRALRRVAQRAGWPIVRG